MKVFNKIKPSLSQAPEQARECKSFFVAKVPARLYQDIPVALGYQKRPCILHPVNRYNLNTPASADEILIETRSPKMQ